MREIDDGTPPATTAAPEPSDTPASGSTTPDAPSPAGGQGSDHVDQGPLPGMLQALDPATVRTVLAGLLAQMPDT